MWLNMKIRFINGEKTWRHALGIWIPGFTNLPRQFHIDIDVVHNPVTLQFSVEAKTHPQLDDGHFSDDEIELV